MVREITNKCIYVCPYCYTEYNDEDDCRRCIEDCLLLNPDDPIVRKYKWFECEICRTFHTTHVNAEVCEMECKRGQLIAAGLHPQQTKLIKGE